MKKIIFEISLNDNTFYEFAFKLREIDSDDKFTRRLLQGRLNPPILIDILLSNKFVDDHMEPDPEVKFDLFIDQL